MAYTLSIQTTSQEQVGIISSEETEITLNDAQNKPKDCNLSLLATAYHKKMYRPGEIYAKIKLSRKNYSDDSMMNITPQTIIDYFRDKWVSLTRNNGDTVATDYYIYKVLPSYQRDSTIYKLQYVEITCYCYSRDHKLTLNPYCKTYVNKKLIGTDSANGIIQKEITDGILSAAGFTTETIDCDNVHLLKYICAASQSKNSQSKVDVELEKREFIQPYLVQYNESFYDFLARTANRCGEFLYYEGGKLYIGAPLNNLVKLDASKVQGFSYIGIGSKPVEPVATYTDGMDLRSHDELYISGDASYFSYDEVPFDEYLGMYLAQNMWYDRVGQVFASKWPEIASDFLGMLLNYPNISSMIAEVLVKYKDAYSNIKSDATKRDEDNKSYFDLAYEDQKDYEYEDPGVDKEIKEKDLGVTLYGSMLTRDTQRENYEEMHNLNAKFYRFVDKCTHDVAQKLIKVEVDLESSTCALGDKVQFNGGNYIVVEVEETLRDEAWDSSQTSQGQTIVLAPEHTAYVMAYNPNAKELDDFYAYVIYEDSKHKIVIVTRTKGDDDTYSYQKSVGDGNFETAQESDFETAKQYEELAVQNQTQYIKYKGKDKTVAIRIVDSYSYSKTVDGEKSSDSVSESDYSTAIKNEKSDIEKKISHTYKDENGSTILITKCTKVVNGGAIQGATDDDYQTAINNAYEWAYSNGETIIAVKQENGKYLKKVGIGDWTSTDKDFFDNAVNNANIYTYKDEKNDDNSPIVLTIHNDNYFKTIDSGVPKAVDKKEFPDAQTKEIEEKENKEEHTYTADGKKITIKRITKYIYFETKNGAKSESIKEKEFKSIQNEIFNDRKKQDDVYNIKTELKFFCPPAVVPFTKQCGTQRAFVARNKDPEDLGRVCIRYPWQKKGDEPSPWIRMAVPFAPNDPPTGNTGKGGRAGMFFEPEVGDEVLVEYENGNIEHPFIVGSLCTRRAKVPAANRGITSLKGHSITFNDNDTGGDFLSYILPVMPMLNLIFSANGVDLKWKEVPSGGLTLSDKYGIYKISASTTKRKVLIRSTFGDVEIDAFSGISINAPSGDVKITGKNVTIEAGNEIKLISGTNIDEKRTAPQRFFQAVTTGLVNGVANYVMTDMKLLRVVYEWWNYPIGGTLSLNSGRYLILNAGGAKAEIPNRGLSVHGMQKEEKDDVNRYKLANTLAYIPQLVDGWIDNWKTLYNNVRDTNNFVTRHPIYLKLNPTFNPINKVWSVNQEPFQAADFTFDDSVVGASIAEAQEAMLLGMGSLQYDIVKIHINCKNIKGGFIGNGDPGNKFLWEELRCAIDGVGDTLWPQWVLDIINKRSDFADRTQSDWDQDKKLLRRVITVALLNQVSKMVNQYPEKGVNGGVVVTFATAADYLDDTKWHDYIHLLDAYKPSFWENLLPSMDIKTNFSVVYSEDDKLWDTCKQGEILMSEKGGQETIRIVNGAITRTPNFNRFVEKMKETLRNL